ncbi:TPA: BRO family protein [Salmonella enterica]
MTALAIKPIAFSFHETHDVRIQVVDGEPWFCLKDVIEVLDIPRTSDLVQVAKGVVKNDTLKNRGSLDPKGVTKNAIPTDGGRQQLTFVSEPNLYRVIFRSNKPEAKQFQDWVFNDVLPTIRKTGRYQKQPPSEPLNSNDMSNLKRLVWMMTGNMRYENAWNAGVWYALRSATGRPSPQPFSVEDLPALGEECRRIMKITAAVHSAVTDFEKEVIRKVVRKRGEIEPVLNEMRIKMLELHEQESQGILMLDKLSEHGVNSLINRN